MLAETLKVITYQIWFKEELIMQEFINLGKQEKFKELNFFNDLKKIEKLHDDYEQAFSKIGINTKNDIGINRDLLEVLTEIAKQLYTMQSKIYDLERK